MTYIPKVDPPYDVVNVSRCLGLLVTLWLVPDTIRHRFSQLSTITQSGGKIAGIAQV